MLTKLSKILLHKNAFNKNYLVLTTPCANLATKLKKPITTEPPIWKRNQTWVRTHKVAVFVEHFPDIFNQSLKNSTATPKTSYIISCIKTLDCHIKRVTLSETMEVPSDVKITIKMLKCLL